MWDSRLPAAGFALQLVLLVVAAICLICSLWVARNETWMVRARCGAVPAASRGGRLHRVARPICIVVSILELVYQIDPDAVYDMLPFGLVVFLSAGSWTLLVVTGIYAAHSTEFVLRRAVGMPDSMCATRLYQLEGLAIFVGNLVLAMRQANLNDRSQFSIASVVGALFYLIFLVSWAVNLVKLRRYVHKVAVGSRQADLRGVSIEEQLRSFVVFSVSSWILLLSAIVYHTYGALSQIRSGGPVTLDPSKFQFPGAAVIRLAALICLIGYTSRAGVSAGHTTEMGSVAPQEETMNSGRAVGAWAAEGSAAQQRTSPLAGGRNARPVFGGPASPASAAGSLKPASPQDAYKQKAPTSAAVAPLPAGGTQLHSTSADEASMGAVENV